MVSWSYSYATLLVEPNSFQVAALHKNDVESKMIDSPNIFIPNPEVCRFCEVFILFVLVN